MFKDMFSLVTTHAKATKRTFAAVSMLVLALAVAACGSSSSTASTASKKYAVVEGLKIYEVPKLAKEVPASVKKTGLNDITYNDAPPDEFISNGQLVGWEPDLAKAVAAVLGLKIHITASSDFTEFIPGLEDGRYNVSFTSFIVTPARLKVIDIVPLFQAGTAFATLPNSNISITKATDLCGLKVAVITGSAFIEQLNTISSICKSANKPQVIVQEYPDDSSAQLAVTSGRAQVYATSSDQLAYQVHLTHRFKLQPFIYDVAPLGVGISKGIGLSKPIADAVNYLISSGLYNKILAKWGLTSGAISHAKVYSSS